MVPATVVAPAFEEVASPSDAFSVAKANEEVAPLTLESFRADAERGKTEGRSAEEMARSIAAVAQNLDISPAQDGSLRKYVVTPAPNPVEGEEGYYPTDGAQIRVTLAWRTLPAQGYPEPLEQFVWDQGGCMREVSFGLGDCERCDALESAVASMKRGETAVVRCGAYGAGDARAWTDPELGLVAVPPGRAMDVLVTLTSVGKELDVMEMEPRQRLSYGMGRKDSAAKYFKAERYLSALNKYKLVADVLEHTDDMKEEELKAEAKAALRSCKMNEVMCYLKLEDYVRGLKAVDEILTKEPENEKALYRRATCYLQMSEYVRAEADLAKCVQVNPQNREARLLLQQCRKDSKEEGKSQKEAYSRMLSGYAKKTKPKET